MDYKIIFAVLLVAVLLAGCTGQSTTGKSVTGSQTGTQTGTTGTTGQQTTQQGTSLIGKGWAELVGMGIPMECKITFKGKATNDAIKSAVLYMKGTKFKEVVEMNAEGVNIKTTIISKDDGSIYILYDDPTMMNTMTQGKIKCDGIVYSTKEDLEGGVTTTAAVDTSVLQSDDLVGLDCKPAVFGDEMFSTPGKMCTMKEITNALTGGQDICGSITDPAQKDQCEKMLG